MVAGMHGHCGTVEFTPEIRSYIKDLYQDIKKFQSYRKVPTSMLSGLLWQQHLDGTIKFAYIAVPTWTSLSMIASKPKPWSAYLGLKDKYISPWNPLVIPVSFGHNLESIINSLAFDADTMIILKVPLSIFGERLKLMFDPSESSRDVLSDVLRTFPELSPVQGTALQRHETRQHAMELAGVGRGLRKFWEAGADEDRDLNEFLWVNRHSMNEAISSAIHQNVRKEQHVLLAEHEYEKLMDSTPADLMRIFLTQHDVDLMRRCVKFWSEDAPHDLRCAPRVRENMNHSLSSPSPTSSRRQKNVVSPISPVIRLSHDETPVDTPDDTPDDRSRDATTLENSNKRYRTTEEYDFNGKRQCTTQYEDRDDGEDGGREPGEKDML